MHFKVAFGACVDFWCIGTVLQPQIPSTVESGHSVPEEPQRNLLLRMIDISDVDPSAFVPSAVISLKPASFPRDDGQQPRRHATLRRPPSRGQASDRALRGRGRGCVTTLGGMTQCVCHRRCRSCAGRHFRSRISQLRGGRSTVPSPCTSRTPSLPVGGEASAAWLLPLPQNCGSTPGIRHSGGRQEALSIN